MRLLEEHDDDARVSSGRVDADRDPWWVCADCGHRVARTRDRLEVGAPSTTSS